MGKVKFSITGALAASLTPLAQTEGLSLEEFAQRAILTGLLKLEIPGVGIRARAEQAASPTLLKLDQKRNAFLDKKNREEVKRRQESQLREQEARNLASAEKIKQMVDGMDLNEVKALLSAIKTKIGV